MCIKYKVEYPIGAILRVVGMLSEHNKLDLFFHER